MRAFLLLAACSACGPGPLVCDGDVVFPDGQLPGAAAYLQKAAHDPASISVADCAPKHAGEGQVIRCTARGKTPLGAVIAARVDLYVDRECKVQRMTPAMEPCGEWRTDEEGDRYRSVCPDNLAFLNESLLR